MAISFGFSVPFLPGMYVEIAPRLRYGQPKARVLCVGPKWASGKAQANTLVPVVSEGAAYQLFGRGSPLERMCKFVWKNAPMAEIWALAQDAPSDGTRAEWILNVTGTASEAGALYLYIGGQLVRVPVAQGDDATTVAGKIVTWLTDGAMNPYVVDLPVTATRDGAQVTITAKAAGEWANDITIVLNHRGEAAGEKLPTGLEVSIARNTDGAGVPSFDLEALGDEEFDTIGWIYKDAASLQAIADLMSQRWSPYQMIYGHVITAVVGDADSLQTFSNRLLNDPHLSCYVAADVPNPSWEIVGALVGLTDRYQMSADDATLALGFYGHVLQGIVPPRSGKALTAAQRDSLVRLGFATLNVGPSGVYVEVARTTYLRNAQGIPDTSLSEQRTLAILQRMIRRDRAEFMGRFAGAVLAPDGTRFSAGVKAVTPSIARAFFLDQYYKYEQVGFVMDAEGMAKELVIEINAQDPNRLDILYPPRITGWLSRVVAKYAFIYGGES